MSWLTSLLPDPPRFAQWQDRLFTFAHQVGALLTRTNGWRSPVTGPVLYKAFTSGGCAASIKLKKGNGGFVTCPSGRGTWITLANLDASGSSLFRADAGAGHIVFPGSCTETVRIRPDCKISARTQDGAAHRVTGMRIGGSARPTRRFCACQITCRCRTILSNAVCAGSHAAWGTL